MPPFIFFSIKNKLLLSMNQCLRWWIANDVPWLNFGYSRLCVIPSSFSCSVGFMIIYSITLCLLWKNNFISIMNYSIAGYNNLGCQMQIPPFIDPCVLAFRSSAKKSNLNLVTKALYVIASLLHLPVLPSLSFFCSCSILNVIGKINFWCCYYCFLISSVWNSKCPLFDLLSWLSLFWILNLKFHLIIFMI